MHKKTTGHCGLIAAIALVLLAAPLAAFAAPRAARADKRVSPGGRVTRTTSLESLYQDWSRQYLKGGGDERVIIGLGAVRGLTPVTHAKGFLLLNLITGDVIAYTKGLAEASDLWLIDNRPGPNKSMLPEEGDEIVHIGRLEPKGDAVAMLTTNLGRGFFENFELDLAVVSRAAASPVQSRILIGSRSVFERRHTRERVGRVTGISASWVTSDPRVQLGLVTAEVLEGGDLFFRGTFEGNGRTCGSCHPAENNQVIDPKFIKALRARDPDNPLFVAERRHPDRVPFLEKPRLLRNFSLILENVDGFEDPVNKFTMRGVPHTLSLSTSITPPDPLPDGSLPDGSTLDFLERTGWSGDGAPIPGTLRMFPVGAVIQHFTKDVFDRMPPTEAFRLPNDDELDKMVAFMRTTGRTNELNLETVSLTDSRADSGRVLFITGVGGAKCFACHANAGANLGAGANFNFNTGIERVRIKLLNNQGIPFDGGFGGQGLDSFNFDSDGDGVPDSFGNGTFNTPSLVEAADTAPFFHTNAIKTLEAAVGFYSTDTFANSPGGLQLQAIFGEGIDLSSQQNQDVASFLRVINAAFNLSIAIQRMEAAREIETEFGLAESALTNALLRLANEELQDAFDVLKNKNLNRSAHRDIKRAIKSNQQAISSADPERRDDAISSALTSAEQAQRGLGTGLDFDMGEGNLVF